MSLLASVSENVNWFTALLTLAICLAVYVYFQWSQKPPGPFGLPYFGYYPLLSDDCYRELFEMSKKYGKVFCFRYTGQQYAHVADLKSIREIAVTKSDCFDGRTSAFTLLQDIFGGGLFSTNGEQWRVLRKFFIQQFKEFGIGQKHQESIMQDNLKKIVSSLGDSCSKDFDILQFLMSMSDDVIERLIFRDIALDDDDLKDFRTAYRITTEFSNGKNILLAGPMLKYILMAFGPQYHRYRKYKAQMNSVLTKIVRQHEEEFDRNNIRNIVDSYINEKKLLQEKNDIKSKFFTERCLVVSLLQFLGDGSFGPGWLAFAILNSIAPHYEVQKAIQLEIDEVVGRNRFPSVDDRSKLPYTNATIYEGLRTITFFPIFPAVECTKETVIGGCRIPKGTIVAYNMWAALHDPEVYDEPDKFDPTRYLSVGGKKPRCEIPILFGIGKRSCVGESLVAMEIMLYVTTVLQNFDLHPVGETEGKREAWNSTFRVTPRST